MNARSEIDLAERAALVALATLPGVGPARLRVLTDAWGAQGAWQRVCRGTVATDPVVAARLRGRVGELAAQWRIAAAGIDPAVLVEAQAALGVTAVMRGDLDYPAAFLDDPAPPQVLFGLGDLSATGGRTVAIVGTRRCTRYGHDVARRLGAELAEAGVNVVSGLALGVDGAAHRGALEVSSRGPVGRPVGVVGSGLDVVYPSRNRSLWHDVAGRGVLVSEVPLGVKPEPWRFPARNRIIAALAEVVVVVESRVSGGSLSTVEEAIRRGREVMAVPGPISAPASAGTNRLLADGAHPMLVTSDVLELLGLVASEVPNGPEATGDSSEVGATPEECIVIEALQQGPRTFGELGAAAGLPLERLALVVTELEMCGRVARAGGYLEVTTT